MNPSTDWHVNQVRRVIDDAERELGPLTSGQRIDLLLDNCDWLKDSAQAAHMLAKAGYYQEAAK